MMTPFLKVYLFGLSGVLGIVLAVNLIVDPYGLFQLVQVEGVNSPKPKMERHEKLLKAYLLPKIKPQTIIMGTSRADFGIDPNNGVLKDYGPGLNVALAGADLYVLRRYFEHAIAVAPVKQVVIGLDFFAFNSQRPQAPDFNEAVLATNADGSSNEAYYRNMIMSSLFTLDAFRDSIATVMADKKPGTQMIDIKDGMRKFYIKGKLMTASELYRSGSNRPNGHGKRKAFLHNEDMYIRNVYLAGNKRQFIFKNEVSGYSAFDQLKQIIDLCRQHDISAYFLISPVHARQLEVIRVSGLWPLFEQWKYELLHMIEPYGYPLWDFSGYHAISVEYVPKERPKMQRYLDSAHYSPFVGNLMLMKMFGVSDDRIPKNFGFRLHSETIADILRNIRLQQQRYAKKHAEDVEEIELLAKKANVDASRVRMTGKGLSAGARMLPDK